MDGYRQSEFDPDAGEPTVKQPKGRWKWFVGTLVYMIVVFWLWNIVGYPDSFFLEECHGRGCAIEDWYRSYLLIERHRLLDIATFLVMWAPIFGYAGWVALNWRKDDAEQPAQATVSTPSVFAEEDAAERRRKILMFAASSLALGALLIAIFYFKGA